MRKRSPYNEDPPPTINPEGYKYSEKLKSTGVGILRIHASPKCVIVFDMSVSESSNGGRYDSYEGSDFSKDSAVTAHFRQIAVDFLTDE